jgi:hypothetical protein
MGGRLRLRRLRQRQVLASLERRFAQAPRCRPRLPLVDAAQDDWRRQQLEDHQDLRGIRLTWKAYQAASGYREHEHCVFCWHKFLDPQYSEAHRLALENEPDKQSPGGYTNLGQNDFEGGKVWICRRCFEGFAADLEWIVVETDPAAWPYTEPEPDPRPTAADYQPPEGKALN